MKYLLDGAGRAELVSFVRSGTLIGLDFDGTLAPIVARPEDASMGAHTRELLARVARRFPVVILTGRSRTDALRLLSGVSVLEVIGSHGLETSGGTMARFVARVGDWRGRLAERLRSLSGVAIEDKRYSLAVHYRHARDPAAAQEQIEQAAAQMEGARVVGGKAVVNLIPQEAPHKGAALLAATARLGCHRALYVGDDDTDEDVFALGQPERVFGVRVGKVPVSSAPWYLRDQSEVDAVLEVILSARA
jgi:trehalose 6-phosphate phosphatase